jgi:hypothetical protein
MIFESNLSFTKEVVIKGGLLSYHHSLWRTRVLAVICPSFKHTTRPHNRQRFLRRLLRDLTMWVSTQI